jgi:acyl-CoA reductase-like NAD-dependent aldehyde dehydrogenase
MSVDERKSRVRDVLEAAKRLRDPRDPLGIEARRELPAATGLTAPNIERSLAEHVETSASEADLERFVARAGAAARVHVVVSANVFVGVVRAVALAVAAASDVVLRPSTREAVLAPLLCRALDAQGSETQFTLSAALDTAKGDHVHVYGRRETIATIASQCAPGVIVRGHGPGFGVAVVDPRTADLEDAAERLSWDVVAFDQRGCMSPRLAFVLGTADDARRFGARLAAALEARQLEVPRGTLSDDERRDAALYRQSVQAVGDLFDGAGFTVGVDAAPAAMILPPSGRHVHVVGAGDIAAIERFLAPMGGAITSIGVAEKSAHARLLGAIAPAARTLPLGNMQRPPLDGPVDLRDMV